jgi:ribonuclease PH
MSETYKPKIWSPTESSKLSFKVESAQVENTSDEDPVASTAFFKTGIVTSAAGSAYYECGATKVVCAVYGPMPCVKTQSFDRGTLVCEFSFAPFATAPREDGKARRRGRTDPEESLCASMLHDALSVAVLLTKYPKHEVQVHVQVLERGGGELAAAINAASAALADSGIEMYGLAAASTAVRHTHTHNTVTVCAAILFPRPLTSSILPLISPRPTDRPTSPAVAQCLTLRALTSHTRSAAAPSRLPVSPRCIR